ncbi:glycosyltransferase [Brachymonas sp. M4Q-1]|uniref:glycosyltransferase n=1 Tax=Brachymonas sp. M4Q-1 TaxID=3416906 RepID=UPI003CE9AFE1
MLLAAFDGEKYIKEQLDSIFQQSGCDVIDVFVRDDCSRDGTSEVLKNYSLKKDALKVLEADSNTGKAGFNFYELIRYVPPDYDYYAFADQDDIWMPDKLASAVNLLQGSGSECYSCAVEAFWPDGRTSILKQNPRQLPADAFFEAAGQGCTYVFTQAFFVRLQDFVRSHASEIAKFEFHDWLAYVLSRAWGSKWYFDPVPHMRYRQHDNNELGARGGWKSIANRLRKIRSGWYKGQIVMASDIYIAAGGGDKSALDLRSSCVNSSAKFSAKSICLLMRYSRRRVVDRVVIVFSHLMRWI